MTTIVKIRQPETSDDAITDYLTDLLGDLPFEAFEMNPTGNIILLGTKFSMRIGVFLGMPSQAIMAQQQFVKMRHVQKFDKRALKVLDPKEPDSCLYQCGGVGQYGAGPTWQPPPYVDPELNKQALGVYPVGVGQSPITNVPGGVAGAVQAPNFRGLFGTFVDDEDEKAQGFWRKLIGGKPIP